MHDAENSTPTRPFVRRVVLVVLLAIAAFYLWSEHRAHVFGALPYLLLLACPLMHLFHHGGHGHHHHGGPERARGDDLDGRQP